jgi:hypothetical protein
VLYWEAYWEYALAGPYGNLKKHFPMASKHTFMAKLTETMA